MDVCRGTKDYFGVCMGSNVSTIKIYATNECNRTKMETLLHNPEVEAVPDIVPGKSIARSQKGNK